MDVSTNHFDDTMAFTEEANRQAYAYWQACCRGRPMPSRADLNPGAMKKFSPHVGLVEIRPQPDQPNGIAYFIRRAGSRWEDVYGPMTGKFLTDFLPSDVAATWIDAFSRVHRKAKSVRLTARIDFQ